MSLRFTRAAASATLLGIFASRGLAQIKTASPVRIGGEVVAGTVAVPVGLLSGLIIGSGFGLNANSNIALIGAGAGAVFGPPLAVMAVGDGGPPRGRFLPTLGGGTAGYLVTAGVLLYARSHKGKVPSIVTRASFLLPAIGASLAYNHSRR
jgi:hypothetical protein